MKLLSTAILLSSFFSLNAQSAILATYIPGDSPATLRDQIGWDSNNKTHVIIAGQGLMFSAAGYKQAQIMTKLYPEDQILFITNLPTNPTYVNTKQKHLLKLGFSIAEENSEKLDSQLIVTKLLAMTAKIKTLTIISHNGVLLGPWLQGDHYARFDYDNLEMMTQLQPLFTEDAWAKIQGCNSGWYVATHLSFFWKIPVQASFTSTSFYYLNVDGDYELYSSIDEKVRTTKAVRPALVDSWSFVDDIDQSEGDPCPGKLCITLQPDPAPYHFFQHKTPEAAWLPISKTICDDAIPTERCQKALAESIIASTGSISKLGMLKDINVFKSMVYQSICSSHISAAKQKDCVKKVKESYATQTEYFPYDLGTMLKCKGVRGCDFIYVSKDVRTNHLGSENTIFEHINDALIGYNLLRPAIY